MKARPGVELAIASEESQQERTRVSQERRRRWVGWVEIVSSLSHTGEAKSGLSDVINTMKNERLDDPFLSPLFRHYFSATRRKTGERELPFSAPKEAIDYE